MQNLCKGVKYSLLTFLQTNVPDFTKAPPPRWKYNKLAFLVFYKAHTSQAAQ